jgi:hypothetical protein
MTTLERAALWLAKVPPAISGSGGHNTTYTAAVGLVHGFQLGYGYAMTLLAEWNLSCQPPWSDKDLAYKLREASSRNHDKPAGHLIQSTVGMGMDLSRVTFKRPTPTTTPGASEFSRFLSSAFAATEVVCICEQVEEGRPLTSGSFLPVEDWIKRFDSPDSILFRPDRAEGVYVRINPFKPNLYSGSDNDVSAYRPAPCYNRVLVVI